MPCRSAASPVICTFGRLLLRSLTVYDGSWHCFVACGVPFAIVVVFARIDPFEKSTHPLRHNRDSGCLRRLGHKAKPTPTDHECQHGCVYSRTKASVSSMCVLQNWAHGALPRGNLRCDTHTHTRTCAWWRRNKKKIVPSGRNKHQKPGNWKHWFVGSGPGAACREA